MTEITNHTTPKWVLVDFPRMNKQNLLRDNDAEIRSECEDGTNMPERCKVVRSVSVDMLKWDEFSMDMLGYRPEWFYNTGGLTSDHADFTKADGSLVGSGEIMDSPRLLATFHRTSYITVVEVRLYSGRDKVYVNCEGYDYARYVGRDVSMFALGCETPLRASQ